MVEPRRRFRFLKELAEGAFGKVYVAEMITAEGFSSVVAIKLLHGKWAGHQEIAQRSRDEARLLGLLHHRNIVRVEDLTSINGQCAVVMEYLEGVDLKTLISYCRDNGVRLPRRVAFEITAAIAGALDSAYNQVPMRGGAPLHVIHRDIKPSNVMVTAPGDVKVLDFGTARANFEEREAKTQALAFGSQAYMAPERLLGDPDQPAGDVFSLGVNLYELLTFQTYGKIFIRAERYENALEERIQAVDLSDLPEESAELIRDVLRRMLAYDGTSRPSSGEVVDLMDNLADVVNDGGLQRFCRQVVRAALEGVQPVQNPDDPLTGSTLFEDRASGPQSLIPEDNHVEESGQTTSEQVPSEETAAEDELEPGWADPPYPEAEPSSNAAQVTWSQPAETDEEPSNDDWARSPESPAESAEAPAEEFSAEVSAASDRAPVADAWRPPAVDAWRPPASSPPAEPPPAEPPPVARPSAPPPVAKPSAPPRPPPAPQPAPAKGGKGLIVGVAGLVILLVVGVGAGVALLGKEDPPEQPVVNTPVEPAQPAAKAPPGGRYEIGAMDGTTATLKLTLASPSLVTLDSVTADFKQEWDGSGTLELVGIPSGSYKTRVDHAGKAIRATLKLDAGKTCSFTFDAAKGDEWEAMGCE